MQNDLILSSDEVLLNIIISLENPNKYPLRAAIYKCVSVVLLVQSGEILELILSILLGNCLLSGEQEEKIYLESETNFLDLPEHCRALHHCPPIVFNFLYIVKKDNKKNSFKLAQDQVS